LTFRFCLGSAAEGVQASIAASRRVSEKTGKDEILGGIWEFEEVSKVLKWSIPSLSSGDKPPTLSGTFQTDTPFASPASVCQIKAKAAANLSGVKIKNLKVSEVYSVYKGLKSYSRVELDYRI